MGCLFGVPLSNLAIVGLTYPLLLQAWVVYNFACLYNTKNNFPVKGNLCMLISLGYIPRNGFNRSKIMHILQIFYAN